MNSRVCAKLSVKMGKTAKQTQWKSGGEEDKTLTKLIKQGKVNKFTTPSNLKCEHPAIFGSFTTEVIRNHLNTAKRTNDLYCK